MTEQKYDCDQSGVEDGYPLMDAPNGRSLCVRCVRADPNLCGLSPLAVEVHAELATIADPRPSGGWPLDPNSDEQRAIDERELSRVVWNLTK